MDRLSLFLILILIGSSIGYHIPMRVKETNVLSRSLVSAKLNQNWVFPIQGNLTYWGEYFISIGLGTPAQYVNLQVDTGSSDLIVYGKNCDTCNASATYDYTSSSTAIVVQCSDGDYYCNSDDCDDMDPCGWSDSFGDGSTISGTVLTDFLTVGKIITKTFVSLGNIEDVSAPNGFEAYGVDGIWGLAFQDLSGWQGEPAIDILIGDYSLYDSFDLCLGPKGGVLGIGEDYSSDKRFSWTPIQGSDWYTVYMTDWKMGGVSLGVSELDLNWDGVIVDSGTTLLIVPYWVMNPIKSLLNSLCKQNLLVGICGVKPGQGLFDGVCFPMTQAQVNLFPNITISLTNINDLTIFPEDYLWQGAGTPGVYCMGIQQYADLPIILGDVLMQRFHVVFDRNTYNVGFGPLSTCQWNKK